MRNRSPKNSAQYVKVVGDIAHVELTNKYKGVFWHRRAGKYQARIRANGKGRYLGLFDDQAAAARAYDAAARDLHGEFARVNFTCNGGM